MPSTSNLFTIKYVDDDDTGMYQVGEIVGIPIDDLELYISSYGASRLLETLIDLIHVTKNIEEDKRMRADKLRMFNCGLSGKEACDI